MENNWISVEEMLPENMEIYKDRKVISVLVCTKRGTVHSCNRQLWYSERKGGWYGEWGRIKSEIVAWMPLPEPYKANK